MHYPLKQAKYMPNMKQFRLDLHRITMYDLYLLHYSCYLLDFEIRMTWNRISSQALDIIYIYM